MRAPMLLFFMCHSERKLPEISLRLSARAFVQARKFDKLKMTRAVEVEPDRREGVIASQ